MDKTAQRAIELAGELAAASSKSQTGKEKSESAQLARMMDDSRGKAFTFALVDQVFRSHDRLAQAARLRSILRTIGPPTYLSPSQNILLRCGAIASYAFPAAVMSAVEANLRRDSARVILPGESEPLAHYLAQRAASGIQVNLNYLGEAILGEEEAARRLQAVLDYLSNPAIRCVSVKISAIFSQINLLDWDRTLSLIKERLRRLYRAALPEKKLVYLDMEEYRDLSMTLAAFKEVLDEEEFLHCRAGLALQAYLPDSAIAQRQLAEWARQRAKAGGAPVRLRLVKGANLAMENVEAELRGWNPAPYSTKAETDANYRRMLEFGCHPESARAVHLGVASHNLFDVALVLVLREEMGVRDCVELEMLEGMANHQARAVREKAGGLLVYAPAVKREDFFSAMAYLVRRLDENTAPQNFLRDMFHLTPDSVAWNKQRDLFISGWEGRLTVSSESRRARPAAIKNHTTFENTPDTDWTQSGNRQYLYKSINHRQTEALPPLENLDTMLSSMQESQKQWESLGWASRAAILRRCANVMEQHRFETVTEMMHEGKKAEWEADAEISEAVDFANYYASTAASPANFTPLGIVVVTPPWNFPYAIPASGVLAPLMAGNGVILKPAPETVQIAWRLANHLWTAGVPRDVLHFFPCADGTTGQSLITDARVNAVVLTGAYETARLFLKWRPSLRLFAETSGKNAMVITSQADRDLAIRDLAKSAFGHSGQKCSAASLAILHREIYDDQNFLQTLRDAAASLRVGPSNDLGSIVTPLIRAPHPTLLRALTTLDAGEEWLLQPRTDPADPCLWSPGIKLGIKPDSWFHQTECFGPVLGLMRADNLDHAIQLQNQPPFGLTAGLHSLDVDEISHWKERVHAGNLYINRGITGAIVQRQPFGGWKCSSLGPGAKAGGPNYVSLFLRRQEISDVDASESYSFAWNEYFSLDHEPSNLRAESNVFRYCPCRGVILRLDHPDHQAIKRAECAAKLCGVRLHISLGTAESESQLTARLPQLATQAEFLRTIHPPGDELLSAAYEAGLNWIDAPLVADGRCELKHWLREQSVSETRHRYGQLIDLNHS